MPIEELQKDSAELQSLIDSATRQRVKDALVSAKATVDKEIANLEMKARIAAEPKPSGSNAKKRYVKELREYAWDQSNKFVKLFVTLNGVEKCSEENVTCKFTENSVVLQVLDLEDKDYSFTVKNLLHPIDVSKSYRKIKNGLLAIYMKKQDEDTHWDDLNVIQSRTKPGAADSEKSGDLTHGLLDVLKDTYMKGDDKTKELMTKLLQDGLNNIPK